METEPTIPSSSSQGGRQEQQQIMGGQQGGNPNIMGTTNGITFPPLTSQQQVLQQQQPIAYNFGQAPQQQQQPPLGIPSSSLATTFPSLQSNNHNSNRQQQQQSTTATTTTTTTTQSTTTTSSAVQMLGDAMQNEQQVVRSAGRQAICQFLQGENCFACLRRSGKVVVFDTRIPIQLAFYALVEHDMQAAPLWDPSQCKFAGILTVTDFIDIMRYFRNSILMLQQQDSSHSRQEQQQHKHHKNVADLAVHSIADILQDAIQAGALRERPFCAAESTCSLHRACLQLLANPGQDYLPILYTQDMRVLSCLTYTHILEHLVTHFREQRRLFDDSITDLGIGTYGSQLITVTPNHTLDQAMELMAQHGLSALPVVDPTTMANPAMTDESRQDPQSSQQQAPVILGAYSRSDITFLTKAKDAEDAIRNLDLTLGEILAQTRHDVTTPDALRTCSPNHTLQAIFESFAQVRFHRLYVVTEEDDDDDAEGDDEDGAVDPQQQAQEALSSLDTAADVQSVSSRGGDSTSHQTHTSSSNRSSSRRRQGSAGGGGGGSGRSRLLGVVSAKDLVEYFLQDAMMANTSDNNSTGTTDGGGDPS